MASLSEGHESGGDTSIGAAPQSCKECYRRKARCDKSIPTCGLCIKYRRHCLYEKHSRTPLTRRHLTEVEERLERAEALIKKLRKNGNKEQLNVAKSQLLPHDKPRDALEESMFLGEGSNENEEAMHSNTSPIRGPVERHTDTSVATVRDCRGPRPGAEPHVDQLGTCSSPSRNGRIQSSYNSESNPSKASTGLLEQPPQDDFEWDELDPVNHYSPGYGADSGEAGIHIKDGMASLAVNENEAGYLGVASGAALLRILEPNGRYATPRRESQSQPKKLPSLLVQPDINRHITDTMIDSYFKKYHLSYPIIHEPTFRAQYSEVIPQPHGRSWHVLAYVVAAIGVYSSATEVGDLDLRLFEHAKSMLSFDFLEVGNLTLVQALTLISNLQQKRDKPNSGYNYLGLAVRMAIGLGLHKEFPGWNISPLKMEIRRRVWWSLCVFDVGATITFSRPMIWPYDGVEVSFPLNVTDRELTANSKSYPPENAGITPYTAVRTQALFHTATHKIYSRVISKPFPVAQEFLEADASIIQPWLTSLPPYFSEHNVVPPMYALAHAVMQWRYRNLRIIMYRPFVIRIALNTRDGRDEDSASNMEAYARCLEDARVTINLISQYWSMYEHSRLAAWYALYFLFQAALIPCICLRNCPHDAEAPSWCQQISTTLQTIQALESVNSSSVRCYQVIMKLCGRYIREPHQSRDIFPDSSKGQTPHYKPGGGVGLLDNDPRSGELGSNAGLPLPHAEFEYPQNEANLDPIDESPQTQINHVFPMMWPNATPLEAAEEVMGDDAWLEFLRGV